MVKVWNDIDHDGINIPNGYCTPEHSNIAAHNLTRLSHNQELIPRWVQQDLYKKIKNALAEEQYGAGKLLIFTHFIFHPNFEIRLFQYYTIA